MQLKKINGNSYYLPAPTNIGVYQFKDKYTLLIDCGNNNQQARKIDQALQKENLRIKYIFHTHHHIDHSGGYSYFHDQYPGSLFYASAGEKVFLENEQLFSMYIYGGHPPHELSRHFHHTQKLYLEDELSSGEVKINDERFELLALPGHSPGLMGLGTRDSVFYLSDALFSEEIIEKYRFPFLFDIEAQLQSYQKIAQLDYDYFVLGHADRIYTADDLQALIAANRQQLEDCLQLCLELLLQPKSREELLGEICILRELSLDFAGYYFSLSTTAAMLSYLMDQGELEYSLDNGKVYYYRKS